MIVMEYDIILKRYREMVLVKTLTLSEKSADRVELGRKKGEDQGELCHQHGCDERLLEGAAAEELCPEGKKETPEDDAGNKAGKAAQEVVQPAQLDAGDNVVEGGGDEAGDHHDHEEDGRERGDVSPGLRVDEGEGRGEGGVEAAGNDDAGDETN